MDLFRKLYFAKGKPLQTSVPLFLAPAFAPYPPPFSVARRHKSNKRIDPSQQPKRMHPAQELKLSKRDKSKKRGVSAIHRTGHRRPVSMSQYPLPKPVPLEQRPSSKPEVDESHGLWGFFTKKKNAVLSPAEEELHGESIGH